MQLTLNGSELGRRRGGNERYLAGLMAGLAALDHPPDLAVLVCRWPKLPPIPEPFSLISLGPYRPLPFMLWQQTLALRRLHADWDGSNCCLPPVLPCRGAVVVHDLSFRAHPGYFPRHVAWYMRWLTGRAIRQAARVLTVSEFSRRELHRFYKVDPAKVVVAYNGVGPEFQPEPGPHDRARLARYGIEPPYMLAVGNIHPRKNLARLLEAYIALKRVQPGLPPMVWSGLPRWESHELLSRARDAGVILTGFVAAEDLPILYREAMLLVYPSLYEGFGLPPVEAMACGTPVITSSTTALPEVVGTAALTVDPTSPGAIAEAMARLVNDASLRAGLRARGLARASRFRWEETARRVVAALA